MTMSYNDYCFCYLQPIQYVHQKCWWYLGTSWYILYLISRDIVFILQCEEDPVTILLYNKKSNMHLFERYNRCDLGIFIQLKTITNKNFKDFLFVKTQWSRWWVVIGILCSAVNCSTEYDKSVRQGQTGYDHCDVLSAPQPFMESQSTLRDTRWQE